jgi:septal ring factor EnvC (AmiA/AmiB activator)
VDLYNLNRDTQKSIADVVTEYATIKKDIEQVSDQIKSLNVTLENLRDENERQGESLAKQIRQLQPKRWTPQNIVALVGTLFGSGGGITVIVLALLGKLGG